ncbi:MAG TPA: PaaI family thioesterase [Acidimicrobiia bacterium]|nr:PaaI family thioesterase [Acidimicrobiia bacterium]
MLQLDAEGVRAFIESVWPGAFEAYEIISLSEGRAVVRLTHQQRMLRPGGTVSGPSLMALADVAMWVAVLAVVGPVAMTVTTHLDIDFLRFVGAHDVVADTRLLKVGRSLAVGDVLMTADGSAEPCARASVTYAIPPS